MKREFQIRVEDTNDDSFDCVCFSNLTEATQRYQEMLTEYTERGVYHIELLEVLEQDEINNEFPEEDNL